MDYEAMILARQEDEDGESGGVLFFYGDDKVRGERCEACGCILDDYRDELGFHCNCRPPKDSR